MSLPDIRNSRGEERRTKNEECKTNEPVKSFSTSKLMVTPYHKIESLISTKYSSQMAHMKMRDGEERKLITISELKGGQISASIKDRP